MAQTAQVLERPSGTLIEKGKRYPIQSSRPTQPFLYLNGNGIDPPHDWLDDPLEALRRLQTKALF